MKLALVSFPTWATWAPNYTLGILAGAVKKHGYEPVIFDLNTEIYHSVSEEDKKLWKDEHGGFWETEKCVDDFIKRNISIIEPLIQKIIDSGIEVIGISVNSGSRLMSIRMNRMLKEKNSQIITIFGGPDCFRAEYGLKFMEEPEIDAICTGEGDFVLPEFLECIKNKGIGKKRIKGFVTKSKKNDQLLDGGDPDVIMNLDNLAFADYSEMNLEKYTIKNRFTLILSRGCINRCAFCSEGTNFKKYRFRTAENIINEIKGLLKYKIAEGPLHINFNDSLINGNIKELEKLCDMLIEENINVIWGGMALIRKEMTLDFLKKMKKAGCQDIMWGIESGSNDVLKAMKKNFDTELCDRVIKDCYSTGIQQYTNFIVGFPGETEENFIETSLFILRNKKYFRVIGLPFMTIRKNSLVYNKWENYDIKDREISTEWETHDGSNNFRLRSMRRELWMSIVNDKVFHQGKYEQDKKNQIRSEYHEKWEECFDRISKYTLVNEVLVSSIKSDIDFLKEKFKEKPMSYLIWGAGNAGIATKKIIDMIIPNFKIVSYIDKFKKGDIDNISIITPDQIDKIKFDYILIATSEGKKEVEEILLQKGLSYKENYLYGYSVL